MDLQCVELLSTVHLHLVDMKVLFYVSSAIRYLLLGEGMLK